MKKKKEEKTNNNGERNYTKVHLHGHLEAYNKRSKQDTTEHQLPNELTTQKY